MVKFCERQIWNTLKTTNDVDYDEGAFESSAFYRVTALTSRPALGKLLQNKECS